MDVQTLLDAGARPLVVFQMPSLQLRVSHDGEAVTVRSPRGEALGSADLPDGVVSDGRIDDASLEFRTAVFHAMDDAAVNGRVLDDLPSAGLVSCQVALLNPASGRVAVGSYLDGLQFDVSDVDLVDGTVVLLDDQTLVLPSGQRFSPAKDQPLDAVVQRLAG